MYWKQLNTPFEQHPFHGRILYLSRQVNLDPLLGYHLFLQGMTTEEQFSSFLYPNVSQFHNPFLLNDMKQAVQRILKAIHQKENIYIFGDYDCDGITSSTILKQALEKLGGRVQTRLPLREEGYGLSPLAVNAIPEHVSLLITVDNGSSSHSAIQRSKERGLDVIVTDHHEVLGKHPDCLAFINPKRKDNTYPFEHLCGVGVALKLIQALFITLKQDWIKETWSYIEYTTIGTIADVMPLIGENRVICWYGLQKMRTTPNPLMRLFREHLQFKYIDSTSIGFLIGPMLNSCGRISDPNIAAVILQKNAPTKEDVQLLINLNNKRKQVTSEQFQLALKIIQQQSLERDHLLVVQGDFHKGIIGIIAAKLSNHYKKPTIVLTQDGVGSARSGNGSKFSIVRAIQFGSELLKKYGGHEAAAGLSIVPTEKNIQQFRSHMQEAAKQQTNVKPVAYFIDEFPIYNFPDHVFNDLIALEPFGNGHPKPTFRSHNVFSCGHSRFGKNKEHIQFFFSKKRAYAYSHAHLFQNWNQNNRMDVLYTPNSYEKHDFLIKGVQLIK
ncbi:single-stranded-DNA-specific exonuclease RecJ [Bacillus cereus]|uniref:single-stranded-DNA-specific exonuclease RecJ n=1 Tax=Bacillus cereus group TaxID=86661 RepID=UPI000318EC56|nr:single-stranded-DNA-specific exonuclease RecJ [Bacillus cereus]HDR4560903.1 single-stranded-DNA-specific exonuclease RecJ [Bacillus luti]